MQRMLHLCMSSLSAVVFVILSLFGVSTSFAQGYQVSNNNHQGWWNTEYNTTEGTEFWITYLPNGGAISGNTQNLSLHIYATSRDSATISIINPEKNEVLRKFRTSRKIQNDTLISTDIVYPIDRDNNSVSKHGLKIVSTSPISLYTTNQYYTEGQTSKYDATNILPTNSLTGDYIVQTFPVDAYSTLFAFVTPYNSTSVDITLQKTEHKLIDRQQFFYKSTKKTSTLDPINKIFYSGNTFFYSASDTTNKIPADTTLKAQTSLSGTQICTTQPLSLFMGGKLVKITSDPDNHLYTQAYPADKWGKTFIVTPTYGMVYDYVQITACKDSTIIWKNRIPIDTINRNETFIDTIKSGLIFKSIQDYLSDKRTILPNASIYETNNIVQCFLYATSLNNNYASVDVSEIYNKDSIIECNGKTSIENIPFLGTIKIQEMKPIFGSPALTPIIPQEYGMHSNIFATFKSTTSGGQLNHYVNIVTRTSEIDNMYIDGLRIVELPSDQLVHSFTPIIYSEWSYAIIKISEEAHFIENKGTSDKSTFTARVYGLGTVPGSTPLYESYAYAAGSRVSRSADMLVDGEYIKEKSICINDEVKFSALVNFDYDKIEWESGLEGVNQNEGNKDSILYKRFTQSGTDTVKLIITSKTPICSQQLTDTIKVKIIVVNTSDADTLLSAEGMRDGNICLGETFKLITHKGTYNDSTYLTFTADTSVYQEELFNGKRIKFQLDTEYIFIDSIKTIREPHCDSIIRTRFTLRSLPTLSVSDTICVNYPHWPFTRIFEDRNFSRDSIVYDTIKINLSNTEKNNLKRTTTGKRQPTIKKDTVILHSQYGCDSTILYSLIVLPIYNIRETDVQYCSDSINPYIWRTGNYNSKSNHTDKYGYPLQGSKLYLKKDNEESIPIAEPIILKEIGTYVLTDSLYTHTCKCNDNHGCDSVYTVRITVLDQTRMDEVTTLCEDSFFIWKDTLYRGPKCGRGKIPNSYINKNRQIGDITLREIKESKQNGICDTIYTNKVTWCPTYNIYDTIHICEGETYHYRPRYPKTSTYDKDYTWTCDDDKLKQVTLTNTVKTINNCGSSNEGCDSTITQIIYVHPKAHHKDTIRICQSELPYYIQYEYKDSVINIDTVDIEGWTGSTFSVQTTPLQENLLYTMSVTHYVNDSVTYSCDSVIEHYFIVYPEYRKESDTTICDGDSVYWNRMWLKGSAEERLEKQGVEMYGSIKYSDSTYVRTYKCLGDCDSIEILNLHISPRLYYDTVVRGCEPLEFEFNGQMRGPYIAGREGDTTYTEINRIEDTADGCERYEKLVINVGKKYSRIDEYPVIISDKDEFIWQERNYGKLPVGNHNFQKDLLTHNYGCDSIRYINVTVHKSYYYSNTINICQSENYIWKGHKNDTVLSDLNPDIHIFYDSLKTWKGQDSIYELKLNVHPEYDLPVKIERRCSNKMPYQWQVGDNNIDIRLRKTIYETDTISRDTTLYTAAGCDSTIHLLLYIDPVYYKPAYDTICKDTINPTFESEGGVYWGDGHKHIVNIDKVGNYVYFDSLQTTNGCGCDSVYELSFTVLPSYFHHTDTTISEEETYEWQGTIYGGQKATEPYDTLITDGELYRQRNYLAQPIGSYDECDSIYTLSLKIGEVVRQNEFDTICANIPYYDWRRGLKHIQTIYRDDLPHENETKQYQDIYKTVLGFDSIYILNLHATPVWELRDTLRTCRDDTPIWRGHEGHTLFDSKHNTTTILNTDSVGIFTYYDELKTFHYNCDSIHILTLIVSPIYQYIHDTIVCQQQEPFVWQGHTGRQLALTGSDSTDVIQLDKIGDYEYTDHLYSINNCDSVYTLRLHIKPTFRQPATTTDTTICDNQTYHFHTANFDTIYNTAFDWKHKDTIPYTIDIYGSDTTVFGCDSAVHHRVRICHTFIKEDFDNICQGKEGDVYIWHGIRIPTNVETGEYEYYDSLKTVSCPDCLTGGCDSIWILHLRVDSTYYDTTLHTISSEETLFWQYRFYEGNKIDSFLYDDTTYTTVFGCDSSFHLTLRVGKVFRDTVVKYKCKDESFIWYHTELDSINDKPALSDIVLSDPGIYYDSLTTLMGYDSIYVLDLRDNPTYSFADTIEVCKASDSILSWEGHSSKYLFSVKEKRWIKKDELTITTAGTYIYIDSLKTTSFKKGNGYSEDQTQYINSGCDSVWTLQLTVKPSYYEYEARTMCQDDTIHWYDRIYRGNAYGWHYKRIPSNGSTHRDSVYYVVDYTENDSCLYCSKSEKGVFADTYFYDTIYNQTHLGCDSIHYLKLTIFQAGHNIIDTTACSRDSLFVIDYHDINGDYQDTIVINSQIGTIEGQTLDTLFFERERLLYTTNGCDSIVHTHLTVYPSYEFYSKASTCEETPIEWRKTQSHPNGLYNQSGTYYDTLPTADGCDSVYIFSLYVPPRVTSTVYDHICKNQNYVYYDTIRYDNDSIEIYTDTIWHANSQGEMGIYELHYRRHGECDTLTRYFYIYVCPTFLNGHITQYADDKDDIIHKISSDSLLLLHGDYYVGKNMIFDVGTYINPDTITFYDSLTTAGIPYLIGYEQASWQTGGICECDSVFMKHTIIYPVYKHADTISICDNEDAEWRNKNYSGNQSVSQEDNAIIIPAGTYTFYDSLKTIHEYDSIYSLHLIVNRTYQFDETIVKCDNEPRSWRERFVLDTLPVGEHDMYDSLTSINNCDSVYHLHLVVNKSYRSYDTIRICDNEVNTFKYVFADKQYRFDRYETLQHDTIVTIDTTLYGQTHSSCDSVMHLHLILYPTYNNTKISRICENDTVSWQKILFVGSKYEGEYDSTLYDSICILQPNTYNFKTEYKTYNYGCDSVYNLQLEVMPTYEKYTYYNTCDNELFVWETSDRNGNYFDTIFRPRAHRDTTYINPHKATQQQKIKNDSIILRKRMLQTVDDCDSLVHIQVTIKPTYIFVSDTAICEHDFVFWRGSWYNQNDYEPGKYEYKYTMDENECDSIYILRLTIDESYFFTRHLEFCDNETIYHGMDNYAIAPKVIWQPEMGIMETSEIRYRTTKGCDSIFHYDLTIHPTYDSIRKVASCSNVWEELHAQRNVSLDTIYPIIGVSRQPIDTTFTDTLHTIHGCDSVFRLQATIYPAYRHIDYDTICSNETHTWRQHQCSFSTTPSPNSDDDSPYNKPLYFHNIGDTAYYDIYETDHGCDSIYELRLHIKPAYEYTLSPTLCFDEMPYKNGKITVSTSQLDTYDFHQRLWTYTDNYHFYTTENCDSIIHLSLTVYDTTSTHLIDTICAYQRYYPFEYDPLALNQDRSVYHDTSGFYIDSTLNIHGCKHAVFTHLTVIPPTNFTFELPPLCADEKTLEISYQYTGRPIEEFSVIFDSLARAQGFENISHAPITDLKNQIVEIPVPYGDTLPMPNPPYFETWSGYPAYVKEPKRQYVRPGRYAMKIILHNGLCDDEFQTKDTVLNILYPSWIHEQHWNDGIVLFNEIYNGGYTFSDYQWYLNDEPIIGQKREYLYWPDSLALNYKDDINGNNCTNEYRLLLTREDDGVAQFTCPICPIRIYDHIVPKKDYFAVVPTLVVKDNPCVWILSSRPGKYWFYSNMSILAIPPTHFEPNDNNYVDKVCLPVATPGIYLMVIQTDDGEMRTFKIMVVDEN